MTDVMDRNAIIDKALTQVGRGDPVLWHTLEREHFAPDGTINDVWDQIAFHGIAPLLHASSDLIADWPEQLLARIRDEARITALWEATHKRCVADAITSLKSCGITSVVMKGTAMAYSLYDKPSHRRRGDTDLLIKPDDLPRAREALSRAGWRLRESPHGLYFQETWLFDTGAKFVHELDLHWQPHDRPTIQAALRCEDYFGSTRPLTRLCKDALIPGRVITLLQVAINQAWHETRGLSVNGRRVVGGKRLIWVVDCHLLTKGFRREDWEELAKICAQRGIGGIAKDALAHAASVMGTEIPEGVMDKLEKQTERSNIPTYLLNPDPVGEFWHDLRSTPGFKGKLEWLFMNAKPNRAHLERKYPRLKRWPAFALHIRYIAELMQRAAKRRLI